MESIGDEISSIPTNVTNISPHCWNGSLSPENSHSIHWSLNGLIAFGCHNKVIVVDSKQTLRVCQTLNKHKYAVKTVKWVNDNSMKLLSCDVNGNIIVWDVNEASVLTIIAADSKELKHLLTAAWIKDTSKNEEQYNILTLYNGNNLVLYDSENGDVIWKKCFGNPGNDDYFAKRFCIDPFNASNITVSLQPVCPSNVDCCFAVIKDAIQSKFQLNRYMLYISSHVESTPGSPIRSASSSRVHHIIKEMGPNLNKSNDPPFQPNYLLEYTNITYNQSVRDQLIILFQREIMIVDIEFVQVLVMIPIERNCSNFTDYYSCYYRNLIYCLHENGNVSARLLQKKRRREAHIGSDLLDLSYSTLCLSDGVRLTKHNKVVGFSVSPMSEIQIALLMNNSKIFVYKLHRKSTNRVGIFPALSDIILCEDYEIAETEAESKKFNLIMSKWMGAVSSGPHVIRMCPPLTMRNWKVHKPYLAVGDSSGVIQVYNVAKSTLEKELSIHNFPVRGIEWVSLAAFLSFSHSNVQGQSGRVANELCLTDIVSGRSEALRVEANKDSSPIEFLKVSHLKQYFILALKNEPFEIWDLKRLILLQVMAKHSPVITAVEWSPLYNKKVVDMKENNEQKSIPFSEVKENFVVTNANSELHHFSVEGNIVKQISSTPDLNCPNITSIAWKSDHLVLGDADGNLSIWYLKGRVTKAESTHRGWIKKMRFAPGRGNMKCLILFNDGVDIWDIKDVKLYSQLKYPRDIGAKIQDIDWAGSDRPILSLSDDSILIGDLKLKKFSSPLISPLSETSITTPSNMVLEKNFLFIPESQRFIVQSKLFHQKEDELGLIPSDNLQRYLLVAILFGEKQWIRFWHLTWHHLKSSFKCDTNYESFADLQTFNNIQKDRIATYESIRSTHKQNQKCCELNLWLGNYQRAIQLLLETEPLATESYYKDSLKACLIALLTSSSNENQSSHPVVKLVATNLIASDSIDEGIQLLSLIDKAKDACRYLQSHGLWTDAALVAKLRLSDNNEEYMEIMNSYCKHLETSNCVHSKLLCLLSMKSYTKVIEILREMKEIQKAALFCDLLVETCGLSNDVRESIVQIYRSYIILLNEASLTAIADEYSEKLKNLLDN